MQQLEYAMVTIGKDEPVASAMVRALCTQVLPRQGCGRDPYEALLILHQAVVKSILALDPVHGREVMETQTRCIETGERMMREAGEEDGGGDGSMIASPETAKRILAEVGPIMEATTEGFRERAATTMARDEARERGEVH